MKYLVEVDPECLEIILRDQLRQAYVDYKTTWSGEKDSKKYAKAFKRVAGYYSTIAEHELWLEKVKDL